MKRLKKPNLRKKIVIKQKSIEKSCSTKDESLNHNNNTINQLGKSNKTNVEVTETGENNSPVIWVKIRPIKEDLNPEHQSNSLDKKQKF